MSKHVQSLTRCGGRYDGRRRNPFNEIERGDHYVRTTAGWSADPSLGLTVNTT
jgi:hypothetical protein